MAINEKLYEKVDFTFLTKEQVFGNNKLDILKKYGIGAAVTDFALLLGAFVNTEYTSDGRSKTNRTGSWWLQSFCDGHVDTVLHSDLHSKDRIDRRSVGARPAVSYKAILQATGALTCWENKNGIELLIFGEYPQNVVSRRLSKKLESAFNNRIIKETGKSYTTDSSHGKSSFRARTHIEYEYDGKKYIRFVSHFFNAYNKLSNGQQINCDEAYWIEVRPVIWLVDRKADVALSKCVLFSGIEFDTTLENKNFNTAFIKKFMDEFFYKDIIPSEIKEKTDPINKKNIFDEVSSFEALLNEINKISYNLPDEFKKKIDSRINEIINEYKNSLSDKDKELAIPRKVLEKKLSKLLLDLTKYKELYDLSLEINESLNLISDDKIEELKEKNKKGENISHPSDTLNVKNILEEMGIILSKLDENTKNMFKLKIQKLLTKPIDEYLKLTDKELNNDFQLMHIMTKVTFITELSNILTEMQIFYTKNEKFYSFYDSLTSEKTSEKLTNGIDNFIETIRDVLKEITASGYPIKIEEKFNLIFERYKIILESKFKENDLSDDTFKNLEKSFRDDIHPLLIELNNQAIKYDNTKDTICELNIALKLINGEKVEESQNESSIVLYSRQIINELDKSTLSDNEKSVIRKEVTESINSLTNNLNFLNTKEEIAEFKTNLDAIFYRLYMDVYEKINYLKKQSEQKKINNDILDMLERKSVK